MLQIPANRQPYHTNIYVLALRIQNLVLDITFFFAIYQLIRYEQPQSY